MAGVLQHLRSSTLDKRPNPASMVDGQVAINYASGAPGMFFKDSNGDLVKVGPVHVGSGAPNASPASGGTAGNSIGEQWLDTTGGTYVFKIWDGAAWRSEAGEFVNTTGDTMTGALGIIAGSASTPGLFFSGDANTGLYSPGADQLALSTNGTGRLFIDASGDVTLNQDNALHFRGTAADDFDAIVRDETNNALVINSRNDVYINIDANNDSANARFAIASNGVTGATTQLLTVQEDGKVGVGTSSPSVNLQVRNDTTTAYSPGTAPSNTTLVENLDTTTAYTPAISQWNARGSTTTTSVWYAGNAGQNTTYAESAFVIGNRTGASSYAERLRIDGSGRVGIGTTSPDRILDIESAGSAEIKLTDSTNIGRDAYIKNNDGDFEFRSRDRNSNGTFVFLGYGGEVDSEYARFDSSGRLLVGTSSSIGRVAGINGGQVQLEGTTYENSALQLYSNANSQFVCPSILIGRSRGTALGSSTIVQNGDRLGLIAFSGSDGVDRNTSAASVEAYVDGTPGADDTPGRLVFSTTADGASSPTERMRITSKGLLKVTTGTQTSRYTNDSDHAIVQDNSNWLVAFNNTNANPNGLIVNYTAADPNNTSGAFLYCQGVATLRAEIRSNGGLANYQANDVNLSDRNAKKDISPAAGTWDCIKEWEIVNYRYKDQPDDADLNLGVIAQQVAESCPEVITVFQEAKEATEDQPAQEERLGVKEQQMYWMAIKALQEAQLRIETLEAKVAALESA